MSAENEDYFRQRMLEEQLRAQNVGGELRHLHLAWAELYEQELLRISLGRMREASARAH